MKTISKFILITFLGVLCSTTIKSQEVSPNTSEGNAKIKVYYFHYTHRCETCRAVENETKRVLKESFPKHFGKNLVFKSFNIDDKSTNELVEKYQVAGQTLLFISGDKRVNITDEAFMNVNYDPEKFKNLIINTIAELLK